VPRLRDRDGDGNHPIVHVFVCPGFARITSHYSMYHNREHGSGVSCLATIRTRPSMRLRLIDVWRPGVASQPRDTCYHSSVHDHCQPYNRFPTTPTARDPNVIHSSDTLSDHVPRKSFVAAAMHLRSKCEGLEHQSLSKTPTSKERWSR
jgi:hypothetical protein